MRRKGTRDKTHISPRQYMPPLLLAAVILLGITAVFFRMGWHVPEKLQATVTVAIYIPCQWFSYWFFYSVAGIYTEN
jgi:hypothetical protein